MSPERNATDRWTPLVRAAIVAAGCMVAAPHAQAVTITYSTIEEKTNTSASARAGPNGVRPGVADTKSDLGSSTSYSSILDSTVFDQDPDTAQTAIASSGSELNVELLPTSSITNTYAMTVDGITGSAEDVIGGGRADTTSRADVSFLFEVDQTVRFSTYLFTEYGGSGYSTVYLYAPDGSIIISLDPEPTGPGTDGGMNSVGLSGLLQPGGQYRLEAHARSGGTVIGSGTASGSHASGANFLFQLETLPGPPTAVPAPASGLLLLTGCGVAAVLRRKPVRQSRQGRGNVLVVPANLSDLASMVALSKNVLENKSSRPS